LLKEFWPDMKRAWQKKHPDKHGISSTPAAALN